MEVDVINPAYFLFLVSSCCQDFSLPLRILRKRVCSILYTDRIDYLGLDASCYLKSEGQNHGTRCVREMDKLRLSCSGAWRQETSPAGTHRLLEKCNLET